MLAWVEMCFEGTGAVEKGVEVMAPGELRFEGREGVEKEVGGVGTE